MSEPQRRRRAGAPRACFHCHVVKPADEFAWGDGSRATGPIPHHHRRRATCLACEGELAVIAEAERIAKEAAEAARRATWVQDGRTVRRCSKCREVKDLKRDFYKGTGLRPADRYRYYCKACEVARAGAYRRAHLKDPERAGEFRAKRAEWQRSWRRRHPERYRTTRERQRDRVKSDPVRRAQRLEAARMSYRLRRERKAGVPLDAIRAVSGVVSPPDDLPRMPAAPLAEAMLAYAEHFSLTREALCMDAGVDARQLYAWSTGEIGEVQFDVADRVLTALDLAWWEVWEEQEVAAA